MLHFHVNNCIATINYNSYFDNYYWLRRPQHSDRRNKDEDSEIRTCVGNVKKKKSTTNFCRHASYRLHVTTKSSTFLYEDTAKKLNSGFEIPVAKTKNKYLARLVYALTRYFPGVKQWHNNRQNVDSSRHGRVMLSLLRKSCDKCFSLPKKKKNGKKGMTTITRTVRHQTPSFVPSFTSLVCWRLVRWHEG